VPGVAVCMFPPEAMAEPLQEEEVVRDEELVFGPDERRPLPSTFGSKARAPQSRRSMDPGAGQHGDLLARRYRVERAPERIGRAFSVEARHVDLGERVLLRYVPPDLDVPTDLLVRFVRDARAAVKLTSEHTARVLDVGRLETGAPYVVSERPHGVDLGEVMRVRGPLPIVEAVDYLAQASESVADAHALDLLHGSLRTTKLVVTRGPDGLALVKVTDVGLSACCSETLDQSGSTNLASLVDALTYLAPEQIREGNEADERADVWSLGVILYELLTGFAPFRARTVPGLAASIAADQPARLRSLRPDLPVELDAIIERCMAKDPDLRYADIGDLSLALGSFAVGDARRSIDRVARIRGRSARVPNIVGTRTMPMAAVPIPQPLRSPVASPEAVAAHQALSPRRSSPPPPPLTPTPPSVRMPSVPPPLPRLSTPAAEMTPVSLPPVAPVDPMPIAPVASVRPSFPGATSRPPRRSSLSAFDPPPSDGPSFAALRRYAPMAATLALGVAATLGGVYVFRPKAEPPRPAARVTAPPPPAPVAAPVPQPAAAAPTPAPAPPATAAAAPTAPVTAAPAPAPAMPAPPVTAVPRANPVAAAPPVALAQSRPAAARPQSARSASRSKDLFDDAE
jgi:eukaryotic-like serine/threonine-protein kinase